METDGCFIAVKECMGVLERALPWGTLRVDFLAIVLVVMVMVIVSVATFFAGICTCIIKTFPRYFAFTIDHAFLPRGVQCQCLPWHLQRSDGKSDIDGQQQSQHNQQLK